MLTGQTAKGDCAFKWGNNVRHALRLARHAAGVVACACLAASVQTRGGLAQSTGDGVAPAVITDMSQNTGPAKDPQAGVYDADAPVRPHWCNKTSVLVDDIHKLGGFSVMRADIGEGRTLERYWNASEEVVIEHGADGTSCLVDLRRRH